MGIGWTLVGHSERRVKYGDTDEVTAQKDAKCQEKGLMCVLCIGESLEERETGKTDEVNKRQLEACIPEIKDWSLMVIAYEPVWAIGTGKVRIQYGGSVTPENCADLMSKPDIDGFLVGGASLKPSFMEIVASAQAAAS